MIYAQANFLCWELYYRNKAKNQLKKWGTKLGLVDNVRTELCTPNDTRHY